MAEGKHMMYMNILICGSDSDKIIKLENQLEEIGNKENIKINIDTNSCMRQRFIQDWLPENYDILFINLDNKESLRYAKKIRLKDERVHRSEERRVGKEYRYRLWPYLERKKK